MRFAAAPGTGEGLGAHARPRGGAVSTRSRGRAGSVPGVAGCGRTEDPAGPAGARTGSGAGVQTGCAFSWPWVLRRAATLGSGLDAWPPWTRASSERANSGGQRRLSLRTVWPGAVRRLLESDQAQSCGEQTGPPYPRPTSPSRPVGSQRLWFGEPACGHRSYTRVGPRASWQHVHLTEGRGEENRALSCPRSSAIWHTVRLETFHPMNHGNCVLGATEGASAAHVNGSLRSVQWTT